MKDKRNMFNKRQETIEYKVTVAKGENKYGEGNKYYINDRLSPVLTMLEGNTYIFDSSDSSTKTHTLRLSITEDGTHNEGVEYTEGVKVTDNSLTIMINEDTPDLYYYCVNHSGMGGQADQNSTFGQTNFDGSILSRSTESATSGFSIVRHTGTGSAGTIGHGLGAKPSVVLIKNTGASENWVMYHSSLGATHNVKLNNTEAQQDTTGAFNDTEPTSSVFTVHTNTNTNQSGQVMIAYVFTEKTGFSKFGSYKANDQDGANSPFVYTGFKPAFCYF